MEKNLIKLEEKDKKQKQINNINTSDYNMDNCYINENDIDTETDEILADSSSGYEGEKFFLTDNNDTTFYSNEWLSAENNLFVNIDDINKIVVQKIPQAYFLKDLEITKLKIQMQEAAAYKNNTQYNHVDDGIFQPKECNDKIYYLNDHVMECIPKTTAGMIVNWCRNAQPDVKNASFRFPFMDKGVEFCMSESGAYCDGTAESSNNHFQENNGDVTLMIGRGMLRKCHHLHGQERGMWSLIQILRFW
eukprot:473931_1